MTAEQGITRGSAVIFSRRSCGFRARAFGWGEWAIAAPTPILPERDPPPAHELRPQLRRARFFAASRGSPTRKRP
jgi:hypothetical protein